MYDVITVGAATHDVFLLSDKFQLIHSTQFETGIGECIPLGSKIDVDQKVESTGGGATNAAVTFARLGFDAACACKVGDDASGREIVSDLSREGVDTTLIKHVLGGETGYSALLTAKNGERSVLVFRGVSADFKPTDMPWPSLHAKWFYVTSLGGNLAMAERIAQTAAKGGSAIAWNPGHKELTQSLGALKPMLEKVSLLFLNREEAAVLTGQRDPVAAFRSFSDLPHLTVIITDGDKGAYAFRGAEAWVSGTTGAPSVSRTGAGDAFGSGVTAALMKGLSLPEALALGTLNAESVIKQVGAKKGILQSWPTAAALKKVPVRVLA